MKATMFKKLKMNNNTYYVSIPIETVRAMGLEESDMMSITIEKVSREKEEEQ